jgi:tetratricopeptide (TPR) repeat protein
VERLHTSPATEPPDVSQLAPADAARTLGDWNYDRRNWAHAIEHYQEAIAAGADSPDVRTDLGKCFRFTGEPRKALEQYQIAQTANPMHENSLFNQAGLYAEVLHDDQRALATAREFLKRFPQSDHAAAAVQLISRLEKNDQSAGRP